MLNISPSAKDTDIPCRRLIAAILMAAIYDMTSSKAFMHHKISARTFLDRQNPWFRKCCFFLDIDPDFAMEKIQKICLYEQKKPGPLPRN